MVQELNCIDALARVDVLCLDKTGTITEGKMTVEKTISFQSETPLAEITGNLMAQLPDQNPTAMALRTFSQKNDVPDAASRPLFIRSQIQLRHV